MSAEPGDDLPPRRRRLLILLVFLGIILALILAFRAVLMPFLVAIFLAFLLDPVVERLAPLRVAKKWTVGRAGAIAILYLALIGIVYVGVLFAIPALGQQVRQAREDLPRVEKFADEQIQNISAKWAEFTGQDPGNADNGPEREEGGRGPAVRTLHLKGGGAITGEVVKSNDDEIVLEVGGRFTVVERDRVDVEEAVSGPGAKPLSLKQLLRHGTTRFLTHLNDVLGYALALAKGVVHGLYLAVLILMVTAFLVIDRDRIVRFLHETPPPAYQGLYERLSDYIERGLAGVIRGQLLIALTNLVLTFLGLWLLGVRYAFLLSLVAGVFSLIPIFGTILSTIPIVLVAWGAGDFNDALLALGWILLIHFVEANYLNPRIMGSASKIHPVVIIFALLAGEHAFGIVGALLAVPAASIIQSSFVFFVIDRQTEQDTAEPG